MIDEILDYIAIYNDSLIIDCNDLFVLTIKTTRNYLKNDKCISVNKFIQLCNWRVLKGNKIIYSSFDENTKFFKQEEREQIINSLVNRVIKQININKSTNDLEILLEEGLSIQCLAISNYFENWVINEELVCLPGGEILLL